MNSSDETEASGGGWARGGVSAAKKPFSDPVVRAFTAATEIPNTFPGAAYFRGRGFRTYHAVFGMSPDELAAAEEVLGADVVRGIRALQRAT